MTKRFVAIVLAVWMSSAALVVFPANAADPKPHILGGGLFGPGQDVQSGPMNPANAATFVFYSTNNPAHTLLVGATNFTPANGVEPAIWGRNIESWDWTFGDTIVAIAETRRGVNGWSGVNYTTSIDDIIDDPNTTENAGDGTLAAIPTLSPTFGPDWVRLNWALIADTHGNVVSYEVFHGTSASSPPSTPVDRVTHGGMPFTNQSGLTPGLHCFAIGVNYRRENPPSTSVYTTTGLSEPVCKSVVEVAPKITQTTPIDGTTGVALNAPIIIDFSEPMDRPTVVANPMPPVIGGFTYVWSNENRTLTLTHGTNFDPCSRYDVTVTGSDRTGNALVSGFVPNPFHFWTQCPAPSIDKTTPANGAQRVRTDGTIVIEFSEPMQPSTVQFQITPGLVNSPTWNSPTNDVLTITPSQGFAETTTYTIQVLAGQDLDGNDLVGGAAINPWSFKTNTKPNVVIGPSLGGICVPGGSILNIPWTMSDGPAEAPETPPNLLSVKISTTGETSGVINGSWAGWIAPFSYPWSTPNTVNGIVQILIEVTDDVPGETERDTSGMIEIDSTAPSVPTNGFTPSDGATGIQPNVVFQIRFSEPMDQAATWGAVSIAPAVSAMPPVWSAGGTVLNISAPFQPSTAYTVTVGTGAKDDCGNSLTAARTSRFTTGLGTRVPNRPTGLTASAAVNAITLTWTRPATYSDGSQFLADHVQHYIVLRGTSADVTAATQLATPNATTFTDTNVQGGVRYYYWVKVRDILGRESAASEPVDVLGRSPPDGGFPWLLLLIPIIVVLLVLGIWLMRRKPAMPAAPPRAPPGAMSAEAPPPEPLEAPPEETTTQSTSEGGSEFIACPNCGTMVKPTDAECFVCGAKL